MLEDEVTHLVSFSSRMVYLPAEILIQSGLCSYWMQLKCEGTLQSAATCSHSPPLFGHVSALLLPHLKPDVCRHVHSKAWAEDGKREKASCFACELTEQTLSVVYGFAGSLGCVVTLPSLPPSLIVLWPATLYRK